MGIETLLPIGASLLSGAMQSDAASSAADAQSAASNNAIGEQRRQFDLTRGDYAPYRDVGVNALQMLAQGSGLNGQYNFDQDAYLKARPDAAAWLAANPGKTAWDHYQADGARQPGAFKTFDAQAALQQDPSYNFRLQQGQQALDRQIAAHGGRDSGAAYKAAIDYNQGMASTGYNDRMNRLAALAGIGQTATNGTAAAGMNSANQISGLISSQGDASAAARLGQGNIWGNTVNSIGALYGRNARNGGGSGWTGDGTFGGGVSYGGSPYNPFGG